MGWEYAINWLVILPFEITAAGITISYWRDDINIGVWIAVFLTALVVVQVFAVRGYGEGSLSLRQSTQEMLIPISSRVRTWYYQGGRSQRLHYPWYHH